MAAVDEQLQTDATPAHVEFNVTVDWPRRLAHAIDQLRSDDQAEREAAVATLARRPDLARPLLRAAVDDANSSQRWWIEAALQENRASGESETFNARVN